MLEFKESVALEGLKTLDSQAIGALYDRYYPDVYRYVRYRLDDEAVVEDIASEVFLRLLEAGRRGRGPQINLKAWLLGTASHIVADHLRRSYRHPTEALDEDAPDPFARHPEDFERREQHRRVRDAMKNLTDEQQHVLALRFGEGYSLEETASLMNRNINAVKALQFRALAALQREMGKVAND